jgi:cell fate regulator YaaT (PSP1 superfamily)
VFYFTSANRVDFRELVKDLASAFHTRIELRQVGTRDETKYLGGIAPCGRICCCAGNMPEFKKVSVKMAKTQGLSLNPGKISGLCGRLMCCLSYENDYYAEASLQMPKIGAEVGTPEGKAIVASVNMLKMQVKVKIDDKNGGLIFKDYPVDELRFKRKTQPDPKEEDEDEDNLG